MKIVFNEKVISKARPRFNSANGQAYDSQKSQKMAHKWNVASQMRENGVLKLSKQPLRCTLSYGTPFPSSWNTAKKKAFLGVPCICRPDVDNAAKYYLDVMNGIAYEDDAHISQLWVEKYYSEQAYVEILLTPIGGDMIHEHAKTVKGEVSAADLEYMVKKAHRIGLSGRNLVRIYSQEDEEGRHFYFECEAMKENGLPNKGLC